MISKEYKMSFRIGHGYDVHKFIKEKDLILGGVKIPYGYGMEAHSDGDVVLHAICDSLLGASCLGDIGKHFPDNDQSYKNISSLILLERVRSLIGNYSIINIDCTIIAQKPKLANYIYTMRTARNCTSV
jgi:2-C-methyl-D-erythritol 2,4-cyclodiphosphate synthase